MYDTLALLGAAGWLPPRGTACVRPRRLIRDRTLGRRWSEPLLIARVIGLRAGIVGGPAEMVMLGRHYAYATDGPTTQRWLLSAERLESRRASGAALRVAKCCYLGARPGTSFPYQPTFGSVCADSTPSRTRIPSRSDVFPDT